MFWVPLYTVTQDSLPVPLQLPKTITLQARKQEETSSFHFTIKNKRHGLTDKRIVPVLNITASAPKVILFPEIITKNPIGYDHEYHIIFELMKSESLKGAKKVPADICWWDSSKSSGSAL